MFGCFFVGFPRCIITEKKVKIIKAPVADRFRHKPVSAWLTWIVRYFAYAIIALFSPSSDQNYSGLREWSLLAWTKILCNLFLLISQGSIDFRSKTLVKSPEDLDLSTLKMQLCVFRWRCRCCFLDMEGFSVFDHPDRIWSYVSLYWQGNVIPAHSLERCRGSMYLL